MAALGVVRQLRDLAADPQNRRKIVHDQGCLPGLVLLLDHNEEEVVSTALEALRYLCECPGNRPIMKAELGMMFSLEEIMQMKSCANKAKILAKQIHQKLTATLSGPLHETKTQNTALNQQQQRRRSSTAKPSSKGFFLGTNKQNSKVVVLQVHGLKDQMCRKVCEDELLKVKGLVSFTFDMQKSRCTLRVKKEMRAETLVAAVARTTVMFADQVLKNEHGESVYLPLDPSSNIICHGWLLSSKIILSFGSKPALADKENTSLPEYLPEEDLPITGLDKAVTKPGLTCDDQGGSWLSTAATFISNSFYW
ncbi:putative armadillo repeat-containing protein 1 [Apostichopus japonicus]|uniref:Armadillo repeat-containing protein 1 n=1 Tax=Stichopus japonicus TaxID=307972 RepID=A0A2G8L6U7_STIJA|nr:putative armadillo repeat-containing protein 1 [Apostichopus japonicus]